ncbi:MAG: ATP-dependent DNA ligase [Cupriavidus sp.]|nr:MAG: ATP-dependent DNA ligase [Cupriavidus sp.]
MSLKEYIRKRNFKVTDEPQARVGKGAHNSFVIQKHEATRLHYDFRLEYQGTLKSWACPKGLPYQHGEKHLAVMVEDHPIAYADFEGTIPKGQYGGGTVMVWDRGTYEPLTPMKDLDKGKLHFTLQGGKLKGEWYFVRLRGEDNQWLVVKGGGSMKPISKKADDTSVLSGRTMKQLAKGDRIWQSKETAPKHIGRARAKAAPLPDFVEPMKAKLAAAAPHGDWVYEIKFDGWRALALKGGSQARLVSRNEKDFGSKFPEVMESLALVKAQDAIIDGEIVALDEKGRSSFQLLQAYDMGQERPPIYFYAFDLLQLNGKDMKKCPLEERKALLEKLLKDKPGVLRFSAGLGGDADSLLDQARKLGLEGLIGKKAGSLYEVGSRSSSWIKLKLLQEQEFVIGGYTDPEGSRQYFGALIVGFYKGKDLIFAGKVGTGFNAKLLRTLHSRFKGIAQDQCPFANLPLPRGGKWGQGITKTEMRFCHWVEPIMVCQVKFGEWTRDDRLRQPVFLGLREDKDASEVVREKAK